MLIFEMCVGLFQWLLDKCIQKIMQNRKIFTLLKFEYVEDYKLIHNILFSPINNTSNEYLRFKINYLIFLISKY
jgi:hypothetical protein